MPDTQYQPTDLWVANEDMDPQTNIYGRDWISRDGTLSGTFYGRSDIPREAMQQGILWRFPPSDRLPTVTPPTDIKRWLIALIAPIAIALWWWLLS